MDDDDVRGPEQASPSDKTEQQIFDEQIERASGKTVVMFGGLGILAALVMSAIALVNSTGGNHTTTIAGHSTGAAQPAPLTGTALGAQLFVSGKPDAGAIGCASCHTMKSAGARGTVGPNLDKD
jgi:cytochrome c553